MNLFLSIIFFLIAIGNRWTIGDRNAALTMFFISALFSIAHQIERIANRGE